MGSAVSRFIKNPGKQVKKFIRDPSGTLGVIAGVGAGILTGGLSGIVQGGLAGFSGGPVQGVLGGLSPALGAGALGTAGRVVGGLGALSGGGLGGIKNVLSGAAGLVPGAPQGTETFIDNLGNIIQGISAANEATKQGRNVRRLQEAAIPGAVTALRSEVAGQAAPLAGQLSAQLAQTNQALADAEEEQAEIMLAEAERLNLLAGDQVAEIRRIAQETGTTVAAAAEQLLGEDGISAALQGLQDQVPQILETANNALQAAAGPAQATEAALAGQAPVGFEQEFGQGGIFDQLFQQSQETIPDIRANAEELVNLSNQQSQQDEDRAIEQLRDEFASLGLAESGAAFTATADARRRFSQQRSQNAAQIRQQAEVQAQQLIQQSIQLGNQISAEQVNRQVQAGQFLAGSEQADLQRQSNIAQALANVGLSGAEVQANLAATQADVIQTGANIAAQGGLQVQQAQIGALEVERSLGAQEAQQRLAAANLPSDVAAQQLRNTQGVSSALISQGLTGTAAGIQAASQFANIAQAERTIAGDALSASIPAAISGISSIADAFRGRTSSPTVDASFLGGTAPARTGASFSQPIAPVSAPLQPANQQNRTLELTTPFQQVGT